MSILHWLKFKLTSSGHLQRFFVRIDGYNDDGVWIGGATIPTDATSEHAAHEQMCMEAWSVIGGSATDFRVSVLK